MKKVRKSLAIFLAVVMCLSLLSFGAVATGNDLAGQIVIIHTNDTHGRDATNIGTAAVAQLKKDYEARGANVLLISAGDAIQGAPLVTLDLGKSAIDFMNIAGYDIMAPGNHEFDEGTENLLEILKGAEFDVISATIFEDGELLFDANVVYDFDGVKVGVFGLTTPETYTKAHPDKIKGLDFLMGTFLYEAAQAQVDYLKAEGCDFIIAVGHLGTDEASAPDRSTDVIANVNGIDLFIDGHSHSRFEGDEITQKDGTSVTLLVSAGQYLERVGVVTINPATAALTAELLETIENKDADVDKFINDRNDAVEEELKTVIGLTEFTLYGKNTTDPPGVRMSETNMGNFATDALLWKAREELGSVDLALTNGGGVRDSIPMDGRAVSAANPYDITMKDMVTVFPFGNTLTVIEVTGAELLEALEAAVFATPAVNGGFPQVSGIAFEIHIAVPYAQGAQYSGSTYYAPANPGARVQNVRIGGEALNLTKTYKIATNDFTAAGGDTYLVFRGKPSVNTGVAMEQALIDYIEHLGGTVGAKYAEPEGRIELVKDAPQSWAVEEVEAAIEAGLVPASLQWNYRAATTRAEFAELAVVMYELLVGEITDYKTEVFPDNNSTIANKAYAIEVVTGVNGLFAGSNTLNRQDAATMLVRLAKALGSPLPLAQMDFTDNDRIPAWVEEAVGQVQAAGVMTGEFGAFVPRGSYQRQQSIATIYRLFEYVTAEAELDNAA